MQLICFTNANTCCLIVLNFARLDTARIQTAVLIFQDIPFGLAIRPAKCITFSYVKSSFNSPYSADLYPIDHMPKNHYEKDQH